MHLLREQPVRIKNELLRYPCIEIPIALWGVANCGESAEQKLFGSQLLDGVAQACGFLKFEFLCCLTHIRLELHDVSVEVLLRFEVGHRFGLVGKVGVVGFENPGE